MTRFTAFAQAGAAALLLASCAVLRPTPAEPSIPRTNLAQVLSDPAVERVTRALQTSGFELKAARVSEIPLLADSPGASFAVADGSLHVHAYGTEAMATAAVGRIVNSPVGRFSWPFPPIFYQCGSAIAMYAGPAPSVASALRQLCASPFYVHPSLREHSAEVLGEGPRDLRTQIADLGLHRRQIVAEIWRKARRNPAARSCRSADLPPSAFLPVEITGDADPELAVSLSQLRCPAGGLGTSPGGIVQFWSTAGRQPRLILEAQAEGFAPGEGTLVTLEPGSSCGAGTARCLVTYSWNPKTRTMAAVTRTAVSPQDGLARIMFDHQLRRHAVGSTRN